MSGLTDKMNSVSYSVGLLIYNTGLRYVGWEFEKACVRFCQVLIRKGGDKRKGQREMTRMELDEEGVEEGAEAEDGGEGIRESWERG